MSELSKLNYTRFPNIVADNIRDVSNADAKLLITICRQTFGYHREDARLSLSELVELTGISRQGILNSLESLIKRGWVLRHPKGQSFSYSINVETFNEPVNSVDQLPAHNRSTQLTRPVNSVDQQPVNSVDRTYKESTKRKSLKKKGAVAKAPGHPDTDIFKQNWDEAYQAHFGREYVFNGGRDAKAVKELLMMPGYTWEAILEIATRAWSKRPPENFWCRQVVTYHDLRSKWNQVLNQLDPPKKAASATPVYSDTHF